MELEEDRIGVNDLFVFETERLDRKGNVRGRFRALSKPRFMSLFKKRGVDLDESVFVE